MSMKKVVVFTTAGKSGAMVETEALNWEQLKKDLSAKGVSYNGMKAVIGQTKVTLENPEAELPEGDFNLFLFPVKTKSGAYTQNQANALSYSALRAAIKDAFTQNEEAAKAHFNAGKNYTNKSTQDLKDLLAAYKYPKAKAGAAKEAPKASTSKAIAKPVKEAPAKKNVADVVKSVAKDVTKGQEKSTSTIPAKTTSKAVAKVEDSELAETVSSIVDMISALPGSKSDKDAAVKAVLKLKVTGDPNTIDIDALEAEAKALGAGFSDIKH